jgi:hypothetical protein
MGEDPPSEWVQMAAWSDAAFDGRSFDGLSAVERNRYIDRAKFTLHNLINSSILGSTTNEMKERLDIYVKNGGRW